MSTTRGFIQPKTDTTSPRILLRAADSDGELAVVELDPGTGPPLHLHPTHAEGFFVLAGAVTIQVGDDVISGGPGTWAFAPRNTPHTLANLTEHPARLLCVFAPAGFERRFERILAEQTGQPIPEPSAEVHTQFLGPTLMARAAEMGE